MGGKAKNECKAPDVGQQVWVLWPLENSWYEGSIIDKAGVADRKVQYFLDGDVRWHNLGRGMRWEPARDGASHAPGEKHRRDATAEDLGRKRRKRTSKPAPVTPPSQAPLHKQETTRSRGTDTPQDTTDIHDDTQTRHTESDVKHEDHKLSPTVEIPPTASNHGQTTSAKDKERSRGNSLVSNDSPVALDHGQTSKLDNSHLPPDTNTPVGRTTPDTDQIPVYEPKTDAGNDRPNINVIVLLESARIETIKAGKNEHASYQLMNCDDHRNVLSKRGGDPKDARPDITHQCLLSLLDSPLNKSGLLKVYIRTERNVLIEIHKNTRIPRTFRRFAGLMVELLQRQKIRATNSPEPLLKVIRGPLTAHLPVGCRKVVLSYNCDNLVNVRHHAKRIGEEAAKSDTKDPFTVLYVVGAMAHGKVDIDWADDLMSISDFPLSASTACHRIMAAYEELLDIL